MDGSGEYLGGGGFKGRGAGGSVTDASTGEVGRGTSPELVPQNAGNTDTSNSAKRAIIRSLDIIMPLFRRYSPHRSFLH